jgi:PAS domain S-box-containing protein
MSETTGKRLKLTAVLKSAGAILQHQEFPDAAQAIFNACKDLIGASAGYVALLSETGEENEVAFLDPGIVDCTVDPALPMPVRGLRSESYKTGEAVCENDFANSRWVGLLPEGHAPLENVLFAPLVIDGKAAGLLGLANKPGGFTQEDADIASAFGQIAAVALYNTRTLESLKKSEHRFRSVVEASVDAVISADSDGNITFWNEAAENIFGYAAEEAHGRPLTLIMPKHLRAAHEKGFAKVRTARGSAKLAGKSVELMAERKDGRTFPIDLSLSSWTLDEQVFFTGIIRDITKRKQAEQSLAAERERLAVTLGSIGEGVISTDTEGRVVEMNAIAESLTGWRLAEAAGKQITDVFYIINETTRRPAEDPVRRSLQTGLIVGLANHTALIAKDGTEHSIADSCAPIRDKDGILLGAVLVFRDVTAQRDSEATLLEQEERYATLFKQSPDGVLIIDPETAVAVEFNDTVLKLLGYTKVEFAKLAISDYEAVGTPEEIRARMDKVLREGSDMFETKHRAKDGSIKDVQVRVQTIKLSGKRYFMCIFRDISEQKRAKTLSDALTDINAAIHSTLDLNEILKNVVVRAARAIGCDAASVNLRENQEWIQSSVYGPPSRSALPQSDSPLLSLAAKTQKPVIANDAQADPRFDQKTIKKLSVRSALAVPIIFGGQVTGVIDFQYHSAAIRFSNEEADFAQKVADSVGLAVRNARLYEAERNLANTLQEALLTMPKALEGIRFAHLYQAATDSARVGGDFFDLFDLGNGIVGIVIGDVSGKGLQAATFTSFIKSTIKACSHLQASPASAIAQANRIITKATPSNSFVSVFFATLNTASGNLTYCLAGHPPPLLKRQAALKPYFLAGNSPVLGVFADAPFTDGAVVLNKGDVLVAYTDGVTEARNAGGFFGEERLLQMMTDSTAAVGELPKSIFDEVTRFAGGRLVDDLALLAMSLDGARKKGRAPKKALVSRTL